MAEKETHEVETHTVVTPPVMPEAPDAIPSLNQLKTKLAEGDIQNTVHTTNVSPEPRQVSEHHPSVTVDTHQTEKIEKEES